MHVVQDTFKLSAEDGHYKLTGQLDAFSKLERFAEAVHEHLPAASLAAGDLASLCGALHKASKDISQEVYPPGFVQGGYHLIWHLRCHAFATA